MKIARVFPRLTRATPQDALSFFSGPGLFPPEVDAVHVSVTFTWDLPKAESLAKQWSGIAPVEIGGPALGMRGDEFVPGMYVRDGYTITSRGCPNTCWFCSVWKRDGQIRELPIHPGWNVLDDNLLACSDEHVRKVFSMLSVQPFRAEFTGGLEARVLKDWHIEELRKLNPKQMFFAYDTADDYEFIVDAGKRMLTAGFTAASHAMRCYVLIGFPTDTPDAAEKRLRDAASNGFFPMAMLWRRNDGSFNPDWKRFQRQWARPHIVSSNLKAAEGYS